MTTPVSREQLLAILPNSSLNPADPELTAWSDDVLRIAARNIDLKATQEQLEREVQTQQPGRLSGIAGDKSAELSFTAVIQGVGNGADSNAGITATEDPDDVENAFTRLLECGGFSSQGHAATTLTGSPSASSLPVTSATGFVPNITVAVLKNPTTNKTEARLVTSIATSTLSVSPAFSFTPAASAIVYGVKAFRLVNSAEVSLEAIRQHRNGSTYRLTGGRSVLKKIDASVGKEVTADWTIMARDWATKDTDGTTDLSDVFLTSDASFPALVQPTSLLGNDIIVTWGTTAFTVAGCTVDPGLEFSPQIAAVANGKTGYFLSDANPTVTLPTARRMSLLDDYASKAIRPLIIQFGNTPGNTVIVVLIAAEIVEFPGEVDVNKQPGHQLKFRGTLDHALDATTRAAVGFEHVPPMQIFLA